MYMLTAVMEEVFNVRWYLQKSCHSVIYWFIFTLKFRWSIFDALKNARRCTHLWQKGANVKVWLCTYAFPACSSNAISVLFIVTQKMKKLTSLYTIYIPGSYPHFPGPATLQRPVRGSGKRRARGRAARVRCARHISAWPRQELVCRE